MAGVGLSAFGSDCFYISTDNPPPAIAVASTNWGQVVAGRFEILPVFAGDDLTPATHGYLLSRDIHVRLHLVLLDRQSLSRNSTLSLPFQRLISAVKCISIGPACSKGEAHSARPKAIVLKVWPLF